MGKLKDIWETLKALWAIWPFLIAAGTWIIGFGKQIRYLSLPTAIWVGLGLFFFYGVIKSIQAIMDIRRRPIFSYKGLDWQPRRLRLLTPKPLCPYCSREVTWFLESATPSLIVARSISDIENFSKNRGKQNAFWFCREHGVIGGVPADIHPNDLQDYARDEMHWRGKRRHLNAQK